MTIRFAEEKDLEDINRIRRQVNELHVNGKPGVFRPGFSEELRAYIYAAFRDPQKRIVVCEKDGSVCAFAVLLHTVKPESVHSLARRFLEINELGVDEACRRQGIGAAMIAFIRDYAKSHGFDRMELNMWEFNEAALKFYEAVGFSTYRRYLEMQI